VGDSFRVSRAGATVLESSEVGQRSPESRSVPLSTASLSRRSSRPSRCFIRSAVGRSVDCGSNAACASYFVGASEHQIKARSRCTCLRQSSAIDLSDRRLPPVPPQDLGAFLADSSELAAWVAEASDEVIVGHIALHAGPGDPSVRVAAPAAGLAPHQLAVVARLSQR
jgi:hypothetical protein